MRARTWQEQRKLGSQEHINAMQDATMKIPIDYVTCGRKKQVVRDVAKTLAVRDVRLPLRRCRMVTGECDGKDAGWGSRRKEVRSLGEGDVRVEHWLWQGEEGEALH